MLPLLFIISATALAQTHPAYEVISVTPVSATTRPAPPAPPRMAWQPDAAIAGATMNPGGFSSESITAGSLALYAFNLTPDHITGAPDWFYSPLFAIRAKASHPAPPAEQRLMLQSLLESEFRLAFHLQTKEGKTYGLTALKNLKLKPAAADTESGIRITIDRSATPPAIVNHATSLSMEDLATWLSDRLETPVTNETKIEGRFDFDLRLQSEAANYTDPENYMRALRIDTGLDLQSRRGPITTFVIDKIQKP